MAKNDKIKIVQVVGGLNYGGVEKVILNYFSNMYLSKYELTIISHEKSNEECKKQFEKLGFSVYEVPSKKENFKENIKQLYKIIKKIKPDIVHSHLTLSNYAPLFVAWLCNVKIRISHSHLVYDYKTKVQKLYAFLSNLFATHYMACGRTAAIFLFGEKKVKKEKVYILNNAVNIQDFQYDEIKREKIRKELKIEDKFVIGNIGRFHEQKNHTFLIDAFKKVKEKKENAILLLIGNGKLKKDIENKVKEEKLEDNVIILSGRDDVSYYYQAMDLFVLPSLYEGLGMVLIEAQIAGLSCLASATIPSEVKITPLLKFLNINDSSLWAKEMLNSKRNNERTKYLDDVKKSGYDIREEAKKLEQLYAELRGDKNDR